MIIHVVSSNSRLLIRVDQLGYQLVAIKIKIDPSIRLTTHLTTKNAAIKFSCASQIGHRKRQVKGDWWWHCHKLRHQSRL